MIFQFPSYATVLAYFFENARVIAFDEGVAVAFLMILVVIRNVVVEGPQMEARFFFVGSDLLFGFMGIGIIALIRQIVAALSHEASPNAVLVSLGTALIFACSLPLMATTFLTERAARKSPKRHVLSNFFINLTTGLVPLVVATCFFTEYLT